MSPSATRHWARTMLFLIWLGLSGCGGGGDSSSTTVQADRTSVQVSSTTAESTSPTASVVVHASNMPASGLFAGIAFSGGGISSADWFALSDADVRIDIVFSPGLSLAAGIHDGNLQFTVCYDDACTRQVGGSPINIQTRYVVTASGSGTPTPSNPGLTEPGVKPIAVLSRQALSHDVVDAEYSKALDAIVMVSSWPANALYILDPVTGTERQQLLVKVPTSVSISPDGTLAAVGHDALITHVDLQAVGTPTSATRLLNVSTGVFDLVLDGRGSVHAFPVSDQWVEMHTVNVATNTETLVPGLLYAGTHARLHPSGNVIYTANNGLSPSDIAKIDVSTQTPVSLYDSPYHGDYPMCGDLWYSEDGATIYTRCGYAFRSSTVQAQDMLYAGRLTLSSNTYSGGYAIQSLSHSAAKLEIALIEYDSLECSSAINSNSCYHHLGLYESSFLNRTSVASIPPLLISGTQYAQRGLFVFHRADGSRKYLITRLHGMPNPLAEYHVSTME